jgi:hypothetical protein
MFYLPTFSIPSGAVGKGETITFYLRLNWSRLGPPILTKLTNSICMHNVPVPGIRVYLIEDLSIQPVSHSL